MREPLYEVVNSWIQQTFMTADQVPSMVPQVSMNQVDTSPALMEHMVNR